jgi:hypothetical protein
MSLSLAPPSWWRPSPHPRSGRHSRDADLEEVVLDQLLPQHYDAQLDAELHQAAPRGALRTDGEPRQPPGAGRGPGLDRQGEGRPARGPTSVLLHGKS